MPIVKTLKQHTVLFDTHVFLWYMEGNTKLRLSFQKKINGYKEGHVLLSPISIWEIGMLVEKKRISLEMDVLEWVQRALVCPLIQLAPLTPEIAIQSTRLPGAFHGDPCDRMLVATSHVHNAVLVTCDEKLIELGKDAFFSVHNPNASGGA